MQRKEFLQTVSLSATGLLAPAFVFSQTQTQTPEPLPDTLVKEFVIAGHGNFDKTKQLLTETPNLLYATHDWGKGDFETALEGAGHVGNKEIANFLIEKGARTNLFVLTMLGKTNLVKSFLETFPSFINARGPHGLTLLHHAQKGGEPAKELLDYLTGKGLKETKIALY
ncbi:MAG: ankyrin repeat domain-containing protein [Bacteroidota bacterium]